MKKIIYALLIILISHIAFANKQVYVAKKTQSQKYNYSGIPVLVLHGSSFDMGYQYGIQFKQELFSVLSILKDYYIGHKHLTYNALVNHAELLYNRYPRSFQTFLQAEAKGSGLRFSDVKILNAMETLGEILASQKVPACAFLYMPPTKTISGYGIIGRNYDFSAPFDQLAKYLTVVILNQPNKIATAFISIAGEVYCPTCINANGLFMELNSGSPSGGAAVNLNTQSMLIRMLKTLQDSKSLSEVSSQLNNVNSDFSFIVNVADKVRPLSFEYSTNSILGMNYYSPDISKAFAVTNFYLDRIWENRIPNPTDYVTWMGVTRRNNLINLSKQTDKFNIISFQKLM
ncbi:MAG: hypothetical protein K2P99_04100, partial [Burkholderiales bacterium]|nr:hypothetical protein [Burkholderiales bacterium]